MTTRMFRCDLCANWEGPFVELPGGYGACYDCLGSLGKGNSVPEAISRAALAAVGAQRGEK